MYFNVYEVPDTWINCVNILNLENQNYNLIPNMFFLPSVLTLSGALYLGHSGGILRHLMFTNRLVSFTKSHYALISQNQVQAQTMLCAPIPLPFYWNTL